MPIEHSRRRFLTNAAFAGAAGLVAARAAGLRGAVRSRAAEPPPEVTTIRLEKIPVTCVAPQYVAEELLYGEGFIDVRFQTLDKYSPTQAVAYHQLDWELEFAPDIISDLDKGPVTIVAGLHAGCVELFVHEHIRTIADLKGRRVGFFTGFQTPMVLLSIMANNIGLDSNRDIHWVPTSSPTDLFLDGKVDAVWVNAPATLELRARRIGRSIVNTATDLPWSQYFCCMLIGSTQFIQNYPVATKRFLRAILKATDLCASQHERVARLMAERGFRYDYALQTLQELPYGIWREYDPEDTLRFYALRMNEAGFTKYSPQRIIAEHANWRFLNELKRELKA
jgi:NitT/TauT family transport system substrate-binding protein